MSDDLFSLDGAVVLVTGAAGGIGSRVAVGLATRGALVACVDSSDSVDATHKEITEAGGTALALQADVSDADSIAAAVDSAQAELGLLNGAVNGAGINNQVAATEMTAQVWSRTVEVNLSGVFFSCRAEGRAMIDNGGGSIVNIGSISATIANRGVAQAHYNSSKAGVLHLTRSLALEWAPQHVRVNSVSPGYTLTPMAMHPDVWPHVEGYVKDIPMGRMAEPDELVGPVVFLLSRAASYCTGADLIVDGGAVAW
jgi:NAD(P)-dependent dehydrogenase (short-subunit alcohol dehydrogenase family)